MSTHEYEKAFSKVCRRYYYNNDEVSRFLIESIQNASVGQDCVVYTAFKNDNEDRCTFSKSIILAELMRIGIDERGVLETKALHSLYLQQINSHRIEYHAYVETLQKNMLQRLIMSSVQQQHLYSQDRLGYADKRLGKFIKNYAHNIGAHPFLKGIRRLLAKQVHHTTILRWSINDAVFTQSGKDFMVDAVQIMCFVLQMKAGTDFDLVEKNDGVRQWSMSGVLNLKQLKALLAVCAKDKDLVGRATGNIEETTDECRRLGLNNNTGSSSSDGIFNFEVFKKWLH